MKYFPLFLFLAFVYSCGPVYTGGYNSAFRQGNMKPSGPGCYTKCLMPDHYNSVGIPIIEYTGTDLDDPNVTLTSTIIKQPSSKWVKKKANKNCLSANPDDCLVWCLVEEDAEYYEYHTLIDTSINKQFVIKELEAKNLVKQGGYTEWQEVICENEITSDFFYNIQESLIELDYLSIEDREENPKFSPKLKGALSLFQRDNQIAIGALTIESLSLLGVLN